MQCAWNVGVIQLDGRCLGLRRWKGRASPSGERPPPAGKVKTKKKKTEKKGSLRSQGLCNKFRYRIKKEVLRVKKTEMIRHLRKVLPYAPGWYSDLSEAQLSALYRKNQGAITATLVAEACAQDDARLNARLRTRSYS